jgi:hypothetical protein
MRDKRNTYRMWGQKTVCKLGIPRRPCDDNIKFKGKGKLVPVLDYAQRH